MRWFCLASFCTPAFSTRSGPGHPVALSIFRFWYKLLFFHTFAVMREQGLPARRVCISKTMSGFKGWAQDKAFPGRSVSYTSLLKYIDCEAFGWAGTSFHLIIRGQEVSCKLDSLSCLQTFYSSISLLIWSSNLLLILKTVLSRPKEMVWSCFFLLPGLRPGQPSPESRYWVSDAKSQQGRMLSNSTTRFRRGEMMSFPSCKCLVA